MQWTQREALPSNHWGNEVGVGSGSFPSRTSTARGEHQSRRSPWWLPGGARQDPRCSLTGAAGAAGLSRPFPTFPLPPGTSDRAWLCPGAGARPQLWCVQEAASADVHVPSGKARAGFPVGTWWPLQELSLFSLSFGGSRCLVKTTPTKRGLAKVD